MPQTQNWLQRHSLVTLYTLFILSLVLMIFSITCLCIYVYLSLARVDGFNVSHKSYNREVGTTVMAFFCTSNALVIFRVFAVNALIVVLHIALHVCALICLLLNVFVFTVGEPRNFYQVYQIPSFSLIAAYILQSLMAFHLVIFRPGLTPLEREKRAGLHNFTGLITFVIHVWNVLLRVSMLCASPEHILDINQPMYMYHMLPEPMTLSILINLYILFVLVILLTPYFEADYRDEINEMNKETKEREIINDRNAPRAIYSTSR